MLAGLCKANALSGHKVEKEVCGLLHSKRKENYCRCESRKDICPEFKLKGLLSISIQSNIFFRRDSLWRRPCHCRNIKSNFTVRLWLCGTHQLLQAEKPRSHSCVRALILVCKVNPPDEERLPKSGLLTLICAWIASSWIHLHKLSSAAHKRVRQTEIRWTIFPLSSFNFFHLNMSLFLNITGMKLWDSDLYYTRHI